MESRHSRNRYSTQPKTTELPEPSVCLRCLLQMSLIVQFLSSLTMIFLGIYLFTDCSSDRNTDFAGITPLTSGISCLLAAQIVFCAYKTWRWGTIAIGIANCLTVTMSLVYEGAAHKCTTPQPLTPVCVQLYNSLNGCQWLATAVVDDTVIPENTNATIRWVLIILAVSNWLAAIAGFVCCFFVVQSGKAVFLSLKIHHYSIVVGRTNNALDSNNYMFKNIEETMARPKEVTQYEEKRNNRLLEYYYGKTRSQRTEESDVKNELPKSGKSKSAKSKSLTKQISDKNTSNAAKSQLNQSKSIGDHKPLNEIILNAN